MKRVGTAGAILYALVLIAGCRQQHSSAEMAQAAQAAAERQQQADAAVAARRGTRAAEGVLAQLPPPSKSRYLQVRSAEAWRNPFLIVHRKTMTLRIVSAGVGDTLPNGAAPGESLRRVGPHSQKREITLRLIDLPEALASLSEDSWAYGRVVAVEEDPSTPRRERPQMRRNVEAVMAMLNDLDVVVDEWPNPAR